MENLYGKYLVAAVVLCLATFTSTAPVSSIDCTGGSECSTIANSTCDATKKCKCDAAFKDGTGNADGKCVAKGLSDPCDTANTNADCAAVTSSVCKNVSGTNKCACDVKFKESSGQCVKKAVGDYTCPGGNSDCTGGTANLTNSECSSGKCACSSAFKDVSGACVAKGLTDTCSVDADCSGIFNAACVDDAGTKKCTCKANYKTDNDKCNAANVLQTLLSAPVALLLSFLTILITRLH